MYQPQRRWDCKLTVPASSNPEAEEQGAYGGEFVYSIVDVVNHRHISREVDSYSIRRWKEKLTCPEPSLSKLETKAPVLRKICTRALPLSAACTKSVLFTAMSFGVRN